MEYEMSVSHIWLKSIINYFQNIIYLSQCAVNRVRKSKYRVSFLTDLDKKCRIFNAKLNLHDYNDLSIWLYQSL